MSVPSCCFLGFKWDGTPVGTVGKLASNDTYITGSNPDVGILFIHDLLTWKFTNIRLLADHLAREANATVYVPDFFGGEELPIEHVIAGNFDKLDLPSFIKRNSRSIREPEIFACARDLRSKYKKVGAVGYCYGGWACLRLGAQEHQPPLVDCISFGHPSLLTKTDLDEVSVPVQILAPELDHAFTRELKSHAFETIMGRGVPFDYQHFPGVEHACFTRGDENKEGEREAMIRGKNASVEWFKQFLHGVAK